MEMTELTHRQRMQIYLTILAGVILFVLTAIIAGGWAIEIDSCLPIGPIQNSTDNTTYSLQVCPALCQLDLPNITAGSSINISQGTCRVNVSAQGTDLWSNKTNISFTLAPNTSYVYDSPCARVEASAEPSFCPSCPVSHSLCSGAFNLTWSNDTYNWTYQTPDCDINLTISAPLVQPSNESSDMISVNRTQYNQLFSDARQGYTCATQKATYEATWIPPEKVCPLGPNELARGWGMLDNDQRGWLHQFIKSPVGITPTGFIQYVTNSLPTSEKDKLADPLFKALIRYELAGFARTEEYNITDSLYTPPRIVTKKDLYVPLFNDACFNTTDSAMKLRADAQFWGRVQMAAFLITFFCVVIPGGVLLYWYGFTNKKG